MKWYFSLYNEGSGISLFPLEIVIYYTLDYIFRNFTEDENDKQYLV